MTDDTTPPDGKRRHPHKGKAAIDELLAHLLASGATITAAAKKADVARKTVHRRLEDPAFRAKVSEARRGMLSRAAGRLARRMGDAADELARLLRDDDATVRLRAAGKLLELGIRVTETLDLAERVEELEKAADLKSGGADW